MRARPGSSSSRTIAKAFFDAMAFWDAVAGIAFSDSVDGQFVIVRPTTAADRGPAFRPIACPCARQRGRVCRQRDERRGVGQGPRVDRHGSAAGRASCGRAIAAAPGRPPRPRSRRDATGIFSIAFRDASTASSSAATSRTRIEAATTSRSPGTGGATWTPVLREGGASALSGFRSVVTYVPGSSQVLAVGPTGRRCVHRRGPDVDRGRRAGLPHVQRRPGARHGMGRGQPGPGRPPAADAGGHADPSLVVALTPRWCAGRPDRPAFKAAPLRACSFPRPTAHRRPTSRWTARPPVGAGCRWRTRRAPRSDAPAPDAAARPPDRR